jgi:tRNA A37 methylthiotransferase MiaB
VFTYSERGNTHARTLEGKVPVAVRKARNRRLTILSNKKWRGFAERNLGRRVPVLFESIDSEHMIGLTDNYLRVHVTGGQVSDLNSIRQVELTDIRGDYLMGNIN